MTDHETTHAPGSKVSGLKQELAAVLKRHGVVAVSDNGRIGLDIHQGGVRGVLWLEKKIET